MKDPARLSLLSHISTFKWDITLSSFVSVPDVIVKPNSMECATLGSPLNQLVLYSL